MRTGRAFGLALFYVVTSARAPLSLRRMVGPAGGGGLLARLDLGLALLSLEPVDLIAKTLVLLPQFAVLGDHFFDQIQQVDNGSTSAF